MTVGWGIIGTGLWADKNHMPSINQSANGKLIAVCHYRKEKAELYANRNGAKRSYTSVKEMVGDSEIDAVLISSPDNLHREQAILAAEAGKHIYCDLPLSVDPAGCKDIIEACQKAGVKLQMGYQWCYHPAAMEMRRLISSGEIGEVVLAEAHFGGRTTGGQVYWKIPPRPNVEYNPPVWKQNTAIDHSYTLLGIATNQLRFVVGREVEEVTAFCHVQYDPQPRERRVITLLRFEGNIYGVAYDSALCPFDGNNVTVWGTKGRLTEKGALTLDSAGKELEIFKDRKGPPAIPGVSPAASTYSGLYFEGETVLNRLEYSGANMYVDEINAFNKCIEEDTEPMLSGIDGLREREIKFAAAESSRTGKTIKLPKVEIKGKRVRK